MVDTLVRRGSAHPPVGKRTRATNDDFFDVESLTELRNYARPLRQARRARLALGLLVDLLVIFVLDVPARFADGMGSWPWPLQVLVIGFALDLLSTLVRAPFSYWANLVYEKRSGMSTMTTATWAKDLVLETLLESVLTIVLVLPLFVAIRATEAWWLIGALLVLAVQVVFAFVYPVLWMPRFNKFTPLPDGPIRQRIEELARMSQVEIEGVYLMDASKRTTRPNAGVTGFGKTKRVVVNDTICDFPLNELSQVIAHELGHYRLSHIVKSFPFGALQLPFVLGFVELVAGNATVLRWADVDRLGDPASLGVFSVAFGVALSLSSIPSAWLSRKHEREADLEALELLGDPTSFTRMWPRMVLDAKANLEPTPWERAKGSHPEIAERIQFGIDWATMNGVPVEPPTPSELEAMRTSKREHEPEPAA